MIKDEHCPLYAQSGGVDPVNLSALRIRLNGWSIYNPNGTVTYLHLYDAKNFADIIVGTTVPKLILAIPANGLNNIYTENVVFYKGLVAFASTAIPAAAAPTNPLIMNFFTQ